MALIPLYFTFKHGADPNGVDAVVVAVVFSNSEDIGIIRYMLGISQIFLGLKVKVQRLPNTQSIKHCLMSYKEVL